MVKYLNLVSGPRNISTALMYSFAQRADTHVMDEPFYAVYLAKTGVDHPGREQVLQSQSADEEDVFNEIFKEWSRPVLFIKNMAHHIEVLDNSFPSRVTNIFLIRNPLQIIASYAEVIKSPVMRDIGIEYQYELFTELKRSGNDPVVIDSGLILENPAVVLTKLCRRVGVPFTDQMLQWPAGPKPYDGIWAQYWYNNVHHSTGFERQGTSTRELPPSLKHLCDEAFGYYEKLVSFAITP